MFKISIGAYLIAVKNKLNSFKLGWNSIQGVTDRLYRKKINLSESLAGQAIGMKEVDDGIWLVSFMDYDLGYIDLEERTLQPRDNPFGPKALPMSLEQSVTYLSGLDRG